MITVFMLVVSAVFVALMLAMIIGLIVSYINAGRRIRRSLDELHEITCRQFGGR